jgi:hypothetical protein
VTLTRKPYVRPPRSYPSAIPESQRRNAVYARVTVPAAPQQKDAPLRSEPYRRAVASLPCKVCGIEGHSQAAHPNTGKGAGIKTTDFDCFPLCADRPGVRGCHAQFDQGAMFDKATRRALEAEWSVDTRCALHNMGLWPATLSQLPGLVHAQKKSSGFVEKAHEHNAHGAGLDRAGP